MTEVLCGCGCGHPTRLAPKTRSKEGVFKGQPLKFLHNHSPKGIHSPRYSGGRKGPSRNYLEVSVPGHPRATAEGYVPVHVLVVEKALGKYLPKPAIVHHFDYNKRNNQNNNLIVCSDQAYHILIHARQRVVEHGGNPNEDAVCCVCLIAKPRSYFALNRANKFSGRDNQCSVCRRRTSKSFRQAGKELQSIQDEHDDVEADDKQRRPVGR